MQADPGDPSGVETYDWNDPFWRQPIGDWDAMFVTGARSTYVSSALAAPIMVEQGSGLIVNLSFKPEENLIYSASHVTIDYVTSRMAEQLKTYGVTCISLYPGMVIPKHQKVPNSESPLFVGRAIASLAGDDDMHLKTGQILRTHDLAVEYGFTDTDGTQGTID